MYELIYSPSALKQLEKLEHNIKKRIIIALERLRIRPESCDIKKLTGISGYRFRVGDYRVIFDMERERLIILILQMGYRKNIYGWKMIYDVIIIGAGVTGLASAMYSGRLNLKTLVLGMNSSNELPIGGIITLTEVVENYPGFIRLTGNELAQKMKEHALDYKNNLEIKQDLENKIKKDKN